jgi:serine-type D-Ala-D-Ala carboxypeptidase (penicillin-binding protein 5/6)
MPEVYGSFVLAGLWLALTTLIAGITHPVTLPAPSVPVTLPAAVISGGFRPHLTAQAYIAMDLHTGRVLIAYHPRQMRPIASLTKIMTGLLVAEEGQLWRMVWVPPAAALLEPSRDDLIAGKHYSRALLLYSTMMVSANDSAYTLGADSGGGSLTRFYDTMNATAAALGMTDTHYASANGLDDTTNLSTALDQAILARYALTDPLLARIVATRTFYVPWARPVRVKEYLNHNRMLQWYPGTYGVKTGYTNAAGGCLVVSVRRNGRDVLGVVLGSNNIWLDMPRLLTAALTLASHE